jgi:(hydroxyamino)benzene mutase
MDRIVIDRLTEKNALWVACFRPKYRAASVRSIKMEGTNRRLMWHGMGLFVVGLLTGFAEQHFANIRMGLAAHLEGVMNGIFLVALGAAWTHVRLSPRTTATAFWTVLYGTWGNWAVTTLAAIFGTAALSPITGVGHSGQAWQETLVTAGFMSVGISILASSLMVLWGFRASAKT